MLLSGLIIARPVQAEPKPRWELGLGIGSARVPDYRGSDEHGNYTLPFPYLVYRGDVIKADRDGARAQVLGMENLHLDFNLGLSNPVSSSGNRARAGMPERPTVIEVGPSLDARLYLSEDERVRLRFRIPVSYGIALGSKVSGNGWQANPRLTLDVRDVLGASGYNWSANIGPVFASRQRHAWYYDVAPAYATPDRPAYRAKGGYGGMSFTTGLSTRIDRVWVGAYLRHDALGGAAFIDSPLVKTRHYTVVGIAASWVIAQSLEMVDVD
jgi:outer membrane scaffolding protein for murein synthesis (MipA/OmpV family)